MLVRLANDTGGRLTRSTNDLTLGYARAQRDLACRYTVGFKIPANEAETSHKIGLSVKDFSAKLPGPPGVHVMRPLDGSMAMPAGGETSE